jgi:hypothetical protein
MSVGQLKKSQCVGQQQFALESALLNVILKSVGLLLVSGLLDVFLMPVVLL